MEVKAGGKSVDFLSEHFIADGNVGEKGKVVLERKFAKKNLTVTAWSFNDYNLNFTYELRGGLLGTGVSWQTDAATIQTWEKNGKINRPQLKLPLIIEDLNREFDDGQKLDSRLRCDKARETK